ncbi:MAG: MvdC/MvdD family ATP grasp protein, partial [Sciscionella sp.]
MLILTGADDVTARRVRAALEQRGTRYVQWDVGDFPQRLSLAAATGRESTWAGRLDDGAEVLRLEDIDAVYYRRPTEFRLPERLTDEHRRFALAEARAGFGGLLISLPARWVNHPSRIADAEFKP